MNINHANSTFLTNSNFLEPVNEEYTQDTIVNSVIKKFINRSDLGVKKYGTTLDRNDLTHIEWLIHLQEELMDGILYLEKFKRELTK